MTAALYPCRITHVRAAPVRRAFRYRGYLWLVDAGDLPRVPWWLRPFATFRAADHLGDPAAGIRANVVAHLARHGIDPGLRPGAHARPCPGARQIPSLQAITDVLRASTSLRVSSDFPMGPHYARTLHEWRAQFADAADAVSELGFGLCFQRMWDLYLAYSEAGFRAGCLDVHQLLLERYAA